MRPLLATIFFLTIGGVMGAPAPATGDASVDAVEERDLAPRGNPARCPSGKTAVSRGLTPTTNGCSFVPEYKFHACCNSHDRCYGTCSRTKASCDVTFLACMQAVCTATYGAGIARTACLATAGTYYTGVNVGGDIAFKNASEKYCRCV